MKKIFYFTGIALIIASCTEKIDIKLQPNYDRIVVDGSISTDTGRFMINLTHTADYFYNAPVPRVTNATVTLSNGDTTVSLVETIPGTSGIYTTDPSFHGTVGKNYTLDVQLPQPIGGYSFYSATSPIMSVTKLDSTHVIFNPDRGKKGFWEVQVFAQEPGNEVNYYMFTLYRNGILWSDSINKLLVSTDKFINGSYINGLRVFYINNDHPWETLYPGDKITLQMSGITKEYYDYVNEVRSAGFNIPFFMGPPANVTSNVNHGGVGFFVAYSNSYASTIVNP